MNSIKPTKNQTFQKKKKKQRGTERDLRKFHIEEERLLSVGNLYTGSSRQHRRRPWRPTPR